MIACFVIAAIQITMAWINIPWWALVILSLAASVFLLIQLPRFATIFDTEHQRLRLGEEAERVVSQALDPLGATGHVTFHGLRGPMGDIDHVVVGPAGVAVLETKGRTKWGRDAHVRSGRLMIGSRDESKGLDQVRRNAAFVRQSIHDLTGLSPEVEAILVLPSWYITDDSSLNDVLVRNENGVVTRLRGQPPRLSIEDQDRIESALASLPTSRRV